MVDPIILCNSHLLGEHVETHMFVGSIVKGISLDGYVTNNLLEVSSLKKRHDDLAKELTKRGMNHKSKLQHFLTHNLPGKIINYKIDKGKALHDLISRCEECKRNYLNSI